MKKSEQISGLSELEDGGLIEDASGTAEPPGEKINRSVSRWEG